MVVYSLAEVKGVKYIIPNYFVRRLDSVVADAIGSITTNTPVGTAVLIPSLMVSNNAAAANSRVDWNAFFATGAWG